MKIKTEIESEFFGMKEKEAISDIKWRLSSFKVTEHKCPKLTVEQAEKMIYAIKQYYNLDEGQMDVDEEKTKKAWQAAGFVEEGKDETKD